MPQYGIGLLLYYRNSAHRDLDFFAPYKYTYLLTYLLTYMRLPRRLQGQKVKSQGGVGAYCGGHLAAQLVIDVLVARQQDSS